MPVVVLAPIVYLCVNKLKHNKKKTDVSNSCITDQEENINNSTQSNNNEGNNKVDINNNNIIMDDSTYDEAMIAEVMMEEPHHRAGRMSTFLTNMETIGEACTHPVERISQFGRNLHTIKHSILDRGSVVALKDNNSGRDSMCRDRSSKSRISRSNSLDSHNCHNDNTESSTLPEEEDCCDQTYDYADGECYFEEPDVLAVTCHGDEVIRRKTTTFKDHVDSERPSFLGARYETFVSNIDTIKDAIRERRTVAIRLDRGDDNDDDHDVVLTESVHLTL